MTAEHGAVQPYQIQVSQELMDDTHHRLNAIRWDRLPSDENGRYGVRLPELHAIIDHWQKQYSWPAWQDRLNSQPHYLANIDDLDVHYWHIRSQADDAIPLLLVHGWPGSIVEYWDLIGPLTDPAAHGSADEPSFHVVLAELPGFGFSGKPQGPGWGPARMARTLARLMSETLGYQRYAVHGEDWGSIVAAGVARADPEHVGAIHITMPYVPPHGDIEPSPDWEAGLTAVGGYSLVQSQVPDALTLGMSDSPFALSVWILEKFQAWSDNDGSLRSVFDYDHLITNILFYWWTASIISSTRIYLESALDDDAVVVPPRINVPAGVASFPKEPFGSPREWLKGVYDIQRYTIFDVGGHFAAMERPQDVLGDIRAFLNASFPRD